MPYTKEEFYREANQRMMNDPEMIEMAMKAMPVERRHEGVTIDDLHRVLPQMIEKMRQRLLARIDASLLPPTE